MKKILTALTLVVSSSAVVGGEPYYLINRGIVDTSAIAIYGWPDNKTPCVSLEKYMNKAMQEERNYHHFECVDGPTAMAIDCTNSKTKDCVSHWTLRHSLLTTLDIK